MKMIKVLLFSLILLFISGCLSSPTTIEEYDYNGKIVKKTITEESVVKSITEATKNKTIIAWKTGWLFGFQVTFATVEEPTPTFKFLGGKQADGYISALPNQTGWDGIASAISATNQKVSVQANTSGIGITETKAKK